MTFILIFYFLPWLGFENYSISHLCNTGKNSFFDCSILNYFKIVTRYVLEKTYQASWSISIDLGAQYVSSFTEVFILKNSFQILLYAFQKNSTSFLINNMLLTYIYQKSGSAPAHVIVNIGFIVSLYKTICFDQLYQSVYSNSEMLAPIHRWIAGACTFC